MSRYKFFVVLLTLCFIVIFVTNANIISPFLSFNNNISYYENDIKNIILLIGDGMGETHVEAGSVYAGRDLSFEATTITGSVHTLSYSGVTDSAASATAMSTGEKVRNGAIARHEGENLTTILEIAKQNNKKTGVITSDFLSGATPAAFSAHATSRDDTSTIINSQINSQIDLFIGQGKNTYLPYSNQIAQEGYTHITSKDNLNNTYSKIFATLPDIEPAETATETSAYLSDLAEFALNYLDNENGFVLLIEVSDIDKKSHANNFLGMLYELMTLDETTQSVIDWVGARTDTFIMVTADHETGDLVLDKTDTFENMMSSYHFRSITHSAKDVPYYAFGYDIGEERLDNIDIFKILNFLITKSI
ncbi:MAG: alkaline phosphatase [Clostridia bacterium]|nr:alkaline phosphatase [Clostridia bacterium]